MEDQTLKDTIVHELLHTVPGCLDHKGKWEMYAELVNRRLPQYTIKRTASWEEKGIMIDRGEPVYRYILQCSNCGAEFPRERKSKAGKKRKILLRQAEAYSIVICEAAVQHVLPASTALAMSRPCFIFLLWYNPPRERGGCFDALL